MQKEIVGKIGNVLFQKDSGYVIFRMDDINPVTAVGILPEAKTGLTVKLNGQILNHPKYGEQFQFVDYELIEAVDQDGVIGFLAALDGITEKLATKIWNKFQEQTFEVIENEPDKLLTIPRVNEERLNRIISSYEERQHLRELIAFLRSLNVGAAYAARLNEAYGQHSIAVIKANPYVLIAQVRGFGFAKADEIARKLGIKPDSIHRFTAAVDTVMSNAAISGHCYLPIQDLVDQAVELLRLPDFIPLQERVFATISARQSVDPMRKQSSQNLYIENGAVYRASVYRQEVLLAQKILRLIHSSTNSKLPPDLDIQIFNCAKEMGILFARGQVQAIKTAMSHRLTIITGGAGTGKSSITSALCTIFQKLRLKIIGCAPTGRAAQRLKEATSLPETFTIHRLLEWRNNVFAHDSANPLDGDVFIIDEASMTDLSLAYALFDAIPFRAHVILLGDVHQLPSVGAGNVLRDLIASRLIPVVELTEIFRQSQHSQIINVSNQIKDGQFPTLTKIDRRGSPSIDADALWYECETTEIPDAINWLLCQYLPSNGYVLHQIQILSAQHKGTVGNIAINQQVQDLYHRNTKQEINGFRLGSRVIVTANDYDKEVFNGDIGTITFIDSKKGQLSVTFSNTEEGDRTVCYSGASLDLLLAYSISIHKSQGSEFPVVIIPCSTQQSIMLQRNLLYTAATRAKSILIFVGQARAIRQAVNTQRVSRRYTRLAHRLHLTHQRF